MNIDICHAVKVVYEHRIKCAWATFTSQREKTSSARYALRRRLKLFDVTVYNVTPLRCKSMDDDVMKKNLDTTRGRMMRMILQTKRKSSKASTAAHTVNVDEAVDDELHDPGSEPEEDTTDALQQDPNEQEDSNQDADINPSVDIVPQDDLDNELEPWFAHCKVRANHKVDGLLAATGNHVVDPQERAGCVRSKQERLPNAATPAGHNSSPNGVQRHRPQTGFRKQPAKRWEDNCNRPWYTDDTTWLTAAQTA